MWKYATAGLDEVNTRFDLRVAVGHVFANVRCFSLPSGQTVQMVPAWVVKTTRPLSCSLNMILNIPNIRFLVVVF